MKHWNNCTLTEKISRWENVLRVLRNLSPYERKKNWNMAQWGVETPCGTVACAAGHCGMDPWFRRRGLKLIPLVIVEETSAAVMDFLLDGVGHGEFEDDVRPYDFFGDVGDYQIFSNTTPRTVGTVIKEVKSYLKALKADKEEDWICPDYT